MILLGLYLGITRFLDLFRDPHVVLIVVDTLRADKLGAWGHPEPVSPELDDLAARGVRFERVVAQSSWTRPSIGSLVTSRYPRSLGIYQEQYDVLPDRAVTLAEILGRAGYRTYGATANPNVNSVFQFDQGFDVYVDSLSVWGWMRDGKSEGTALIRKEVPIRSTRSLCTEALEWVDRLETGEPVYLQLDLMEVHEHAFPETRRPEIREMFREHPEAGYLQSVRQISRDVSGFVRELESRPGWDDALFVITSDHGEGLGDHPDVAGSASHGRTLYESQIHVPLILYSPGETVPSGVEIERPVRLLDLMPTVLDLVGLDGPPGMQGRSLIPAIRGQGLDLPGTFVFETEFHGVDKIGVADDEWKLILSEDDQAGSAPLELQPNAGPENGIHTDRAKDHPELVRRLRRELRRWEQAHPRAPPEQSREGGPSPEEREQLRALGYVE